MWIDVQILSEHLNGLMTNYLKTWRQQYFTTCILKVFLSILFFFYFDVAILSFFITFKSFYSVIRIATIYFRNFGYTIHIEHYNNLYFPLRTLYKLISHFPRIFVHFSTGIVYNESVSCSNVFYGERVLQITDFTDE